jgi:hypothetical protein
VKFADEHGDFDRETWVQGFISDDPEQIMDVAALVGLYDGIVNHPVEMMFIAARLRGLEVIRGIGPAVPRPSARSVIDAIRVDAGLTEAQAILLNRLYGLRNDLQHASLSVEAAEVFDAAQDLLAAMPRFVRSCVNWLRAHDALQIWSA